MKILRIYPSSINDRFIEEAVEALRDGDIIIYPTDTLYALGCNALNNSAIEKLCQFKGMNPQKETLSVVCSDISQASEYARIDNNAFRYLREYLPGPYTFILPSAVTLPKVFKGRRTVGIRIPDNAISRALAEQLGNPVLSTSLPMPDDDPMPLADPDEISVTYASNPRITLMIDGGSGNAIPSTVVDLTDSRDPQIVRQGAAPFEA